MEVRQKKQSGPYVNCIFSALLEERHKRFQHKLQLISNPKQILQLIKY